MNTSDSGALSDPMLRGDARHAGSAGARARRQPEAQRISGRLDRQQPLSFDEVRSDELKALGCGDSRPERPAGVALSGGGIRSATFCLGVLQALAAEGKLANFDYMSTVSGGGYIGSMLSAWVAREERGIYGVQDKLKKSVTANGGGLVEEPDEIVWLRRYSNYLAPKLGMLSLDTLTLVCAWTRNVFLNWIVLISTWWLVLLLPKWFVVGTELSETICRGSCMGQPPLIAGLIGDSRLIGACAAALFVWIMGATALHLDLQARQKSCVKQDKLGARVVAKLIRKGDRYANWSLVVPILLWSLFMTQWLMLAKPVGAWHEVYFSDALRCALVAAAVIGAMNLIFPVLMAFGLYDYDHPDPFWSRRTWFQGIAVAFYGALATVIGLASAVGLLALVKWQLLTGADARSAPFVWTFVPILMLLVYVISSVIFVGLAGTLYHDRVREWWSRLSARISVVALYWVLLFAFSIYIPAIILHLGGEGLRYGMSLVSASWVATTAWGALRKAPEKDTVERRQRYANMLNIAAAIAVLLILAMLATVESSLLGAWGKAIEPALVSPVVNDNGLPLFSMSTAWAQHDLVAASVTAFAWDAREWPILAIATVTLALTLWIFGKRLDVNKFSLQSVYKNRLVRCYLGATNKKRIANPFTGFDLNDDMLLREMPAPSDDIRPLQIFNTAMNLTQGRNLAWQERKAASFTFSRLHVGYELSNLQGDTTERSTERSNNGDGSAYRYTEPYATSRNSDESGISLGTAMAISGAALSSNMGYHTRPTLSFLLTLFNLRLGKWCPNPRKLYERSNSGFAPLRLLQELRGRIDEDCSFVYLSDGGHFDNTGLYELVRRKCGYILIVDAAADQQRAFEDLGAAVRKCRIDLGAEVRIDLNGMRAQPPCTLPVSTFQTGTVVYRDGTMADLLLIKATMCQDRREPVDIQSYASRYMSFPQQSTIDQFFDESQFESYRKLGFCAGVTAREKFPAKPRQRKNEHVRNRP